MDLNLKKLWPAAAASLVVCTSLSAAMYDRGDKQHQQTRQPKGVINPSVHPKNMNQNCAWYINVEAFAWTAHEDGLEFAIENENVPTGVISANSSNYYNDEAQNLHFRTNFGFKVGLGYIFEHDGWDIHLNWTHFHDKAHAHVEADDPNTTPSSTTLFPLYSAFVANANNVQNVTCSDIEADWKLRLNIVDLELGREFYTSKWLTLRPHVGLRGAAIHQTYEMELEDGRAQGAIYPTTTLEDIHMKNDFKGLGVRAGLDSDWRMGCGWSFYGNAAISILYGKFEIDQRETMGPDEIPITSGVTNRILDIDDDYRASRAITDLIIGIRYEDTYNQGKTYVTVSLGWEHHMFFSQNQLTRFVTIASAAHSGYDHATRYTSYIPEDGDLTTHGWTLGLTFEY